MTPKAKIQGLQIKRKSSLSSGLELKSHLTSVYLCIVGISLTLPLSVLAADTQNALEIPDPVDLLESYQMPVLQNENTADTPAGVVDTQIKQKEFQADTNIPESRGIENDSNLAGDSLFVPKSPTTNLGRQLWLVGVDSIKDREDTKSKTALQQIIQKVRSVEFKSQRQAAESAVAVEPIPQIEPDETPDITVIPRKPEQKKTQSVTEQKQTHSERRTEEVLEIIKTITLKPEQVRYPFELAEALFQLGYAKEAAVCYQQALKLEDADIIKNKDWILFQIGNCLRNDDPEKAIQIYGRVIAEHPESTWMNLAKTRTKLLKWYQENDPKTLINVNQTSTSQPQME